MAQQQGPIFIIIYIVFLVRWTETQLLGSCRWGKGYVLVDPRAHKLLVNL